MSLTLTGLRVGLSGASVLISHMIVALSGRRSSYRETRSIIICIIFMVSSLFQILTLLLVSFCSPPTLKRLIYVLLHL